MLTQTAALFCGFSLSVNSSTNLDAKEMQFCHTVCCRRHQSNTKPSTNMSIHQCINLLNIITPTNSEHLTKLISADYCIGESDAQKSLSIRMRNSCKIAEEKKHNIMLLLINASNLLNLE